MRINPPQTSPSTPAPQAPPAAVPDRERDPEREHDPEQVQTIDRADEPILVEIAPVLAALLHPEVVEHPADVGVHEAAQRAPEPVSVAVRRVRVARLVRERVVLAVVGHPLRHRPLHRHAAEDREQRLDGARPPRSPCA